MKQPIESHQFSDSNGNPAGGQTFSTGLCIAWQNGPLAVDGVREEPNGCFVETVIRAAIDRIEFYEKSRFASDYNKNALTHLYAALDSLQAQARTRDREARGVEGTHKQ